MKINNKDQENERLENPNGFVQTSIAILKIKNEPNRYFQTFELAKSYVETFDVKFYIISNDYIAIDTHNNY